MSNSKLSIHNSTFVPEGQTLRGSGRLIDYSNFVKLPHTLFAMPFALVGATLASYRYPVRPMMLVWAVVAFASARFAAMGFNRIADRMIDARNPRTRTREIPAGKLTVRQASAAVTLASAIFLLSAAMLNRLCLELAPLALAWVFFYSYTKRFTHWSHLVLGFGMAIAPVGAYLAISGEWSRPAGALFALAGAVLGWGAGFDILYALQDEEFDRAEGLHSVPAAFGARGAIRVSRALHLLCVALLALAGLLFAGVGTLYFVGVAVVAALLVYEQSLVAPGDLSRMDAAFFNLNAAISIVFLTIVFAERLLA
ncbi:MAG TPA: UbiA-like polyprenyltransferase [Longimicrobiaceae bacterium]|nr:UbiA-like polyprenyltransferase [Longimicrobiaceae bacterium]